MWQFLQLDSAPQILGPIINAAPSTGSTEAWSLSTALTLLILLSMAFAFIGLLLLRFGISADAVVYPEA